MEFPLITERLLLRPFEPSDTAAMHAIYSDPEVMRWVGEGPVHELRETEEMLRDYATHQQEHGFSFWAIVERDTGALVGDAGLYTGDEGVEVGYTLARDKWGMGYGTEVARACVEAASSAFALNELVATVRPEHPASAAVLTKVGFELVGHVFVYGADHLLYRSRLAMS